MNYLNERTKKCAEYLVLNNSTIRETAKVFNISKSTLHSDFHNRLSKFDNKLYKTVIAILETNYKEKHIRGGESTKNKYKKRTR